MSPSVEETLTIEPFPVTADFTHELSDAEPIINDPELTLPAPVEAFIEVLSEVMESQEEMQLQIEAFIELAEIEIDKEELLETTEVYVQAVASIKETIEMADEVTEEQIEAVVTAVIELLRMVAIEPHPKYINQIIGMLLGEEFVLMYQDLINDRLVDELGTHERRVWPTRTILTDNQGGARRTLIGRIALQLGLSLQLA